LREIAGEKAGILKAGVPAVLAPQLPEAGEVLRAKAEELQCPVVETDKAFRAIREEIQNGCVRAEVEERATGRRLAIALQLAGRFQLQNALNAVAAATVLQGRKYRISDGNIIRGIAAAQWPGRIEKLQSSPDVYLDGAHNPGAARELARFMEENFAGRRVYLIYAAMRDKAVDEVTGLLFAHAEEVIFTEARTPRAISAAQLEEIAGHHAARHSAIPDAGRAVQAALAKAKPHDVIVITGSLYLVGQVRQAWRQARRVASC